MCITATRTGEVCAPSKQDTTHELKRPGTCGACEFARVAAEEKKALAKAKPVADEIEEEGHQRKKTKVEKSLPIRGKGRAPVRQSTRLRKQGK
jgi:hypothetical protein